MARITPPTWPVAPTTPIFMARQANAAARASFARFRSGDGGDEPPVARVDALEDRVGGAGHGEGAPPRRAEDAHVGQPAADRVDHGLRGEAVGLPAEARRGTVAGQRPPEAGHAPQPA